MAAGKSWPDPGGGFHTETAHGGIPTSLPVTGSPQSHTKCRRTLALITAEQIALKDAGLVYTVVEYQKEGKLRYHPW